MTHHDGFSPTMAEHEEAYNRILSFYDLAEALINTVQDESVKNPEAQLDFVEPLIERIEEGADVLAEEYRNFVKEGKAPGAFTKKRIEKAMAQIYTALSMCHALLPSLPFPLLLEPKAVNGGAL